MQRAIMYPDTDHMLTASVNWEMKPVSGFLTIREQRPLWKTELMAVLCFTGVKSFCVPKRVKRVIYQYVLLCLCILSMT